MADGKKYSELLRHPKWQMKRLEILKRDKATCKLCRDKETELHVHHKQYTYGKNPWEYDNSILITLCKHCHGVVEYAKEKQHWMEVVKIQKFKPSSDGWMFMITFFKDSEDHSCNTGIYAYNKDSGEVYFYLTIAKPAIEGMYKELKKMSTTPIRAKVGEVEDLEF